MIPFLGIGWGVDRRHIIYIYNYIYIYLYLYIKRKYAFGLLKKWYEDNATYDKYRTGKVYSSNRKYRREIYTQVIPSVSVFFFKDAMVPNIRIFAGNRWHPAGALIMEVLKIPRTTATQHVGKHPRIQQ